MSVELCSCLFTARKINPECRPLVYDAVGGNKAAMAPYNSEHDRKSKAGASPPFFRSKKWLKYSIDIVLRDTDSRVRNADDDITSTMRFGIIFKVIVIEKNSPLS